MTFEEALAKFQEYCTGVRLDWSDFDGRDLLNSWDCARQEIAEAHAREVAAAFERGRREQAERDADTMDGVYGPSSEGRGLSDMARDAILTPFRPTPLICDKCGSLARSTRRFMPPDYAGGDIAACISSWHDEPDPERAVTEADESLWRGRPIRSMTREELVAALKEQAELYRRVLTEHEADRREGQ
jgi:hypothetical protein